MITRRNLLANSVTFGISAALAPLAFAQQGGGGVDAGEYLPGPFGPLGGNPGDLPSGGEGAKVQSEESQQLGDAADKMKEIGNWGMTAGGGGAAIGGGIVATTGETGIGAVVGAEIFLLGSGVFTAGAILSGTGVVLGWLADDPPRQKYMVNPACEAPDMSAFPALSEASPAARNMVEAALALYASSSSTLAALELWQGAHLANDAQWLRNHRASFVSSWNTMRSDLKRYAQTSKIVIAEFFAEVAKQEDGMTKLMTRVRQNRAQLKDKVVREMAALENAFSPSCANDAGHFSQAAKQFEPAGNLMTAREVNARLDRLVQIADRLPAYS